VRQIAFMNWPWGKRQQTPFGLLCSVMALMALLPEERQEFCRE